MARSNQHYVPQFYFRRFAQGKRTISMLLKQEDRIIPKASIRGQCSKNNFYGDPEIETLFSQLESRHAEVLRKWDRFNWVGDEKLAPEDCRDLWEAVSFQRARTAFEIEKVSKAISEDVTEMFRKTLEHRLDVPNRDEVLEALGSGNYVIEQDPKSIVLHEIIAAQRGSRLLADLRICLLRNMTKRPFIFSDSPVVFYNSYLRKIDFRGVLGLQSPGLQVFYPLSSGTCLMLLDREVYGVSHATIQCDITEASDIEQLNALQLHHSSKAVYFAGEEYSEYVSNLWRGHKALIVPPAAEFHLREDWLINGEPTETPLHHMFERQISHDLKLSFVDVEPISPDEYVPRDRSPELVAKVKDSMASDLDLDEGE